ncbi:hypothetical protein P691DRAFT_542587 [Macrolepiota fuliginosa MF-IS2]|uniref:Uncharacterized protein n=1 Tax=Macrolepiota fuliginosa MF-IS2 TaxID=1400762 RepID=A0A9P5XDX4_9AGAR|nr:hypothetical protein P691DRAFT_542587 [Macrolepiota fuliginosa MF-IS2]
MCAKAGTLGSSRTTRGSPPVARIMERPPGGNRIMGSHFERNLVPNGHDKFKLKKGDAMHLVCNVLFGFTLFLGACDNWLYVLPR